MEIEITLRGESKVQMPMAYIIADINKEPFKKRIIYLGQMIDKIMLSDIQNLSDIDRAMIIDYLARQYHLLAGKEIGERQKFRLWDWIKEILHLK